MNSCFVRGTLPSEVRTIADDKTKTRPQDASKLNIHEKYEVEYWCKKFACTKEQLIAAVHKVGISAKAVEAELTRG